ncbi:MAG: hypothetical protein HUU20_20615 [Pirellulales bacterium]|nr:hypothetical protein [Pirellulales bacterium]
MLMDSYELRDPDDALAWLLQGLWLARAAPVTPELAADALGWSLEIASTGAPLPPIGFVADLGRIALESEPAETARDMIAVPGFAAGLAREYDDYVLGRFYADLAFQRAADALLRYQGRDRSRALAFLIHEIGHRTGVGGAILSPAVVKRLADSSPEEVLAEGWESIRSEGLLPGLVGHYGRIVTAIRNSGDLVGPEDVFELERGTALAEFGQRLALRQVLQAAERMLSLLPRSKPRLRSRSHQVATRMLDEDSYPVGGFASLSTRGSMESLLHSQLSYMEPDDRPDLFDIKFVRDELLYYSRDENQFLRRRRTILLAVWPKLVEARFKDSVLPCQRIVMTLAFLLGLVRKLIQWLSDEAILFEFLFFDCKDQALQPEKELVEILLAEQIANGTVTSQRVAPEALAERYRQAHGRSLCHVLAVSAGAAALPLEQVATASLVVDGPIPSLAIDSDGVPPPEAGAEESWAALLECLLRAWVGADVSRGG